MQPAAPRPLDLTHSGVINASKKRQATKSWEVKCAARQSPRWVAWLATMGLFDWHAAPLQGFA